VLHILFVVASALFVSFALCGSLYVTGFAILGVRNRLRFAPAGQQTRFLVFIPAHNESSCIQATLRSIQQANYPQHLIRVIVIADNCSDDTVERARACGVEAWIRNDPQNPGKGQAMRWAFEKTADLYDLAPIIDADTEVDPDYFLAMDSAYAASSRADRPEVVLQCHCLFVSPSKVASWFEQFAIASKAADSSFVSRPRTSLGLANLISGTGYCISCSALSRVPFSAASIVEDAEYGITLALNGVRVMHVDDARVYSRVSGRMKDAATQRLRWAGGTFSLLINSVPVLLREAVRRRSWRLAEMGFMLLFTSRVILVYATVVSIALLWFARSSELYSSLVLALAASLLLQSIYLYLVLRKADRSPVPFQTIAFMPFYFGFLGVVQLGAVFGLKRKQWNRATR
jgi:1,2-diacylglycerol 3-beta-glucosyltransferase